MVFQVLTIDVCFIISTCQCSLQYNNVIKLTSEQGFFFFFQNYCILTLCYLLFDEINYRRHNLPGLGWRNNINTNNLYYVIHNINTNRPLQKQQSFIFLCKSQDFSKTNLKNIQLARSIPYGSSSFCVRSTFFITIHFNRTQ